MTKRSLNTKRLGGSEQSNEGGVKSVERAFAILRTLSGSSAGISEVSRRIDLPTSTVARLLATLVELGAVDRVDDTRDYQVGRLVLELGGLGSPLERIVVAAREEMETLAEEISEVVGLSVPAGNAMHYVDQVDCQNAVQVRDWTDERIPLHAVSSGFAMLAHWSDAAVERFLARERTSFTARTVTDVDKLRGRISKVASQGYCWTEGEYAEGISSIATAVFDSAGTPVAALHIHGPTFRFPPENEKNIIETILLHAAKISRRLGHRSGA